MHTKGTPCEDKGRDGLRLLQRMPECQRTASSEGKSEMDPLPQPSQGTNSGDAMILVS